jgi:LysM repeat protein
MAPKGRMKADQCSHGPRWLLCVLAAIMMSCNLSQATQSPLSTSTADSATPFVVLVVSSSPVVTSGSVSTPLPVAACSVEARWPTYVVVAGDTLSAIAQRSGTTVPALMQANCLDDPNSLKVGQVLRVPQLPVQPSRVIATVGTLTISPATHHPTIPGAYVVQPGTTVTLRVDGLSNIASIRFTLPPPGWKGNGFSLSDPILNPGSSAEIRVAIPSDQAGRFFPFSVQATTVDGTQLPSGSNPLVVYVADNQPQFGTLSISPGELTSDSRGPIYVVAPGSSITLRIDGLQNVASVRFQIPPRTTWGSHFEETEPILNPGSSAEVQLIVPDRPGNEGLFTAIITGTNGQTRESGSIWARIGPLTPTSSAAPPP